MDDAEVLPVEDEAVQRGGRDVGEGDSAPLIRQHSTSEQEMAPDVVAGLIGLAGDVHAAAQADK